MGINKYLKKISLKHQLFFFGMLIIASFFTRQVQFPPNDMLSPVAEQKVMPVLEQITPLLNKYENDFSVKKVPSIVGEVSASNDYENANAYGAIDFETGEVIVDKNLDQRLPIASITKVMTAIVALDLADSQELFTVSEKASKIIPTKIGVVPGQKLTLSELLNALLLTSANDSAEVIREGIDIKYGEQIFIEAMNKKAEIIGLKNSSFANPQGFDSVNNYSSVEDLAVLTHYALTHYPLISEIVKKDFEFLPENNNHKQFDLYNWNGLIGVYPNTYGVKIGSTGKAGKTTAVVSHRNGKKVIAIVLGAPGVLERDLWASQILDKGFEKAYKLKPVEVTEEALLAKYSEWKY